MATKRRSKKSNTKVRKLDLSDVKGRLKLPVGQYPLSLTDAEFTTNDAGSDQIELTFEVTGGKFKGNTPKAWIPFQESTLWRVRNFLEAVGYDIPDSSFDLDLDDLVDSAEPVIGVVEQRDPNYDPKLQDFLPADGNTDEDDEEDEDEDEAPSKKSKSSKGSKPKDDEDDISASDIKEMDEDELEEVIDEYDLDVDLDDFKTIKKKRDAVIKAFDAREDDDEDDEDEEDDDESYSEDDINEMGTKELRALIKKHDLDVELEGSTKKKRKLVIDALREEELLD